MTAVVIIAAAYVLASCAILRVIRPRPERLSRRQRAIIRYYKA